MLLNGHTISCLIRPVHSLWFKVACNFLDVLRSECDLESEKGGAEDEKRFVIGENLSQANPGTRTGGHNLKILMVRCGNSRVRPPLKLERVYIRTQSARFIVMHDQGTGRKEVSIRLKNGIELAYSIPEYQLKQNIGDCLRRLHNYLRVGVRGKLGCRRVH